jgi:hypothetical protein
VLNGDPDPESQISPEPNPQRRPLLKRGWFRALELALPRMPAQVGKNLVVFFNSEADFEELTQLGGRAA